MYRKRNFLVLLSFILIFPLSGNGQEKTRGSYALNIGFGTEKVGIPFRKVMAFPTHSSYYLGIERKWDKSGVKKHFQTLDIFAFTNNSAGSGYTIQSSFGTNIQLFRGVYFAPSIGGGFVHLFRPKESFYLVDGSYQPHSDKGKVLPNLCLNIKIGYQLKGFGLFVAYNLNTLFGYSEDVGLLPFSFLTVGARYEI